MEENDKMRLLSEMLRIRRFEEFLADQYPDQEIRCPMHLCIGQEATAVGICGALNREDSVYSNHRAHGHYIAKGGNVDEMLAELYGRETGCAGGRGGSMHLIDLEVGFMGATPIVGGTVPLAVGTAWSHKLRKTGNICVVFFGEGCFEEGVVSESLNFAALHKLPIVFVCENNTLSVYTPVHLRQPARSIHTVVEAMGITSFRSDGNDVNTVRELADAAIARARAGDGPTFLELDVYRWLEHCGPFYDNDLGYRTAEEVTVGEQNCPIERLKRQLSEDVDGFDALLADIEERIEEEIESAFQFALSSDVPSTQEMRAHIYAGE